MTLSQGLRAGYARGQASILLLAGMIGVVIAAKQVEMVRERRPWDLDFGLDLAHRHLALGPNEHEEDLEPGQMRQGLEGLDMLLRGFQPTDRKWGHRFHISKSIEIWRRGQAEAGTAPAVAS